MQIYAAWAIETGDTRGFMKAVVDPKTKKDIGRYGARDRKVARSHDGTANGHGGRHHLRPYPVLCFRSPIIFGILKQPFHDLRRLTAHDQGRTFEQTLR